ncbi:MAG TPA: BtrH N-terminal domain-containing protein [Pseudonocardiaceae bacterium]|nr:BtrH N-terminal domain-containing protein [Pseudonocardiaceae bacterium]
MAARTGWRPRWHTTGVPAADLATWTHELRRGRPVIVVGDAYHLPWLPYHGHEHMDHGFVLTGVRNGVLLAVDPYDNATEWGKATPLATELPAGQLDAALADGRWAVLEPAERTDPEPPDNAAAIVAAADGGVYGRFLDGHAKAGLAELHNLSLQCWLLARSRGLHARWLAADSKSTSDVSTRFIDHVVPAWQRASELAYVALRRVRSGRRAPTAVLDAVRTAADGEVRLARELLRHRNRTDGRNRLSC